MAGGGYPVYHPPTHGGHTIPWYMGQPRLLGAPSIAHGCTGWSAPRCGSVGGMAKRHRAQDREKPWVRSPVRVKVVKSVKVGRGLCARLLRFSRVKDSNDRIATG